MLEGDLVACSVDKLVEGLVSWQARVPWGKQTTSCVPWPCSDSLLRYVPLSTSSTKASLTSMTLGGRLELILGKRVVPRTSWLFSPRLGMLRREAPLLVRYFSMMLGGGLPSTKLTGRRRAAGRSSTSTLPATVLVLRE